MECKKCKAQIVEGAKFCTACGAPVEEVAAAPAQPAPATATATTAVVNEKNNTFALVGFIVSLVSLVCCCGSFSTISLILSIVGLAQVKGGNGKGKGFAIAGIVISAVGIIFLIVLYALGQISELANQVETLQ